MARNWMTDVGEVQLAVGQYSRIHHCRSLYLLHQKPAAAAAAATAFSQRYSSSD